MLAYEIPVRLINEEVVLHPGNVMSKILRRSLLSSSPEIIGWFLLRDDAIQLSFVLSKAELRIYLFTKSEIREVDFTFILIIIWECLVHVSDGGILLVADDIFIVDFESESPGDKGRFL